MRLLQQTLFSTLESTPSHASWLGLIFKHENDCPELTFYRIQRDLWLLTEIVRPCSSQLASLILPRTIRLLVPLQSEALVEGFAVQLREALELVTSFAQNTRSYHLRRTCLGLRVTPGSLGSREWLKVGLFDSFPLEGLRRWY